MKSIWKGSLSFGLVNIPINVYPASEERTLEFHMLHKKDLSPIRFARICKAENHEIPYSEIVKGYEYEKDEYVVIDEEDFKRADVKKTSTIEIQHFTDMNQIDPIYFDKPYFLEPDKKSMKAYRLLHAALLKSKKVAIANFVFRHREHIGAILASQEGLQLIQMRYHSDIRPFSVDFPKEDTITSSELKMAMSLIDQLSTPFKPEVFHDTYVEALMSVIEQKLHGKKRARISKQKKITHEARDLMSLLQDSMKKAVASEPKKGKSSIRTVTITKRKQKRK